jgi:hypothetical protein
VQEVQEVQEGGRGVNFLHFLHGVLKKNRSATAGRRQPRETGSKAMIKPIHIATIEHHLRFFRTRNDDGRPDMPWHCVDDLHRCLGLDRAARRIFLRKLHERGGTQAVATADGIITVAPHYMVQGTVDPMVEVGWVPASVRSAYDRAGSDALKKLVAHLTFGTDAWST